MKKLIALLLALLMVLAMAACGDEAETAAAPEPTAAEETTEAEDAVVYYKGTNIPTLDSVLGENVLRNENVYSYGPYDTEEEAGNVIRLYAAALLALDFTENETAVGYELTDGKDTVAVFGGSYDDKLAVAVMVEE